MESSPEEMLKVPTKEPTKEPTTEVSNEEPTSKSPDKKRHINEELLVWIDCEMTGLDPETDSILEVYCVVTTPNLVPLSYTGYHAAISTPRERLAAMDDWCVTTHLHSRLVGDVFMSRTTHQQAADGLLAFIKKHVPEPGLGLLAGNSVHADKAFLNKEPYRKVLDHLHYRILDVSSIKEAARRWCGPDSDVVKNVPRKRNKHRAMNDIYESIEEARHYMVRIFRVAARVPYDSDSKDESWLATQDKTPESEDGKAGKKVAGKSPQEEHPIAETSLVEPCSIDKSGSKP